MLPAPKSGAERASPPKRFASRVQMSPPVETLRRRAGFHSLLRVGGSSVAEFWQKWRSDVTTSSTPPPSCDHVRFGSPGGPPDSFRTGFR